MNRELNNFNEVPEMFPWKPMFNKVIITLNKLKPDNNLILSDEVMSEEQYIVAVGPMSKDYLNVNDKVIIDLEKMVVRVPNQNDTHESFTKLKIDIIEHEDVAYGIVEDRMIKAVYKV